jgi:hypothetical protein
MEKRVALPGRRVSRPWPGNRCSRFFGTSHTFGGYARTGTTICKELARMRDIAGVAKNLEESKNGTTD